MKLSLLTFVVVATVASGADLRSLLRKRLEASNRAGTQTHENWGWVSKIFNPPTRPPTRRPTRNPTRFPTNPQPQPSCGARVRSAWSTQSETEKAEYLRQLKNLMNSGEYAKFVDTHYHHEWNGQAHGGSAWQTNGRAVFLPWHRAYLYEFENAVRAANGGSCFTIKYWDWRVDNFAGDATSNTPQIVSDMGGYFSGCSGVLGQWRYGCTSNTCSRNSPVRCLTRNKPSRHRNLCLSGTLESEVNNRGSFGSVHEELQYGCHVMPHVVFPGSEMGSHESPFDPLFWSHHAMLDYAWSMSQNCGNGGKSSYDDYYRQTLNTVMPGFGADKLIASVSHEHTPNRAWDVKNYATYAADTVDGILHGIHACTTSGLLEENEEQTTDMSWEWGLNAFNWLKDKTNSLINEFKDLIDDFGDLLRGNERKQAIIAETAKICSEGGLSATDKLEKLKAFECSLGEDAPAQPTRAEQQIFFIPNNCTVNIC